MKKDKNKAIELRMQGKSYKEIQEAIPNLSKSTLSGWLSNLHLTPSQQKRLEKNLNKIYSKARMKAGRTKKKNKIKKINEIKEEAKKSYELLKRDKFFLIGLSLYWAEGTKKQEMFQFTNSDPQMIKIMIQWIEKFCGIPKKELKIRLYIHKLYAHENCENFWSKIIDIPVDKFQKTIYKPTRHKMKKKSRL